MSSNVRVRLFCTVEGCGAAGGLDGGALLFRGRRPGGVEDVLEAVCGRHVSGLVRAVERNRYGQPVVLCPIGGLGVEHVLEAGLPEP